MTQREPLLSIEIVTDCDTGIYQIGEFDFSVPSTTSAWLDDDAKGELRRSGLAHFMHWMACEIQRGGFSLKPSKPHPGSGEAMYGSGNVKQP